VSGLIALAALLVLVLVVFATRMTTMSFELKLFRRARGPLVVPPVRVVEPLVRLAEDEEDVEALRPARRSPFARTFHRILGRCRSARPIQRRSDIRGIELG
jgi:hypothetical protein